MKDFRLTLDQVERINESHGGARAVLCHGRHTVELLGADGQPNGWNMIRRDAATGLCSVDDLRGALGY